MIVEKVRKRMLTESFTEWSVQVKPLIELYDNNVLWNYFS